MTLLIGVAITNSAKAGQDYTWVGDPTNDWDVSLPVPLDLNDGASPNGTAFTVNGTDEATVGSTITSTGDKDLIKEGTGTLILTNASNTYTGSTIINAGTLALSGDATIVSSKGVTLADVAGVKFDICDTTSGASIRTLQGGGDVELGGKTLSVVGAGNSVFAGKISDGGSGGGLTNSGAGSLTLSGELSYTGATTINGAIFRLIGDTSIASSSGVVIGDVASAYFDITQTTNGTTIKNLSGGGTTGGAVDLGAKTLTVVDTGDNVFAGKFISNATGKIEKTGAGKLTLSGDSSTSFSGTFDQNAGTVTLSGAKLKGTYNQASGTNLTTAAGASLYTANFGGNVTVDGTLNIGNTATFNGATINIGNLNTVAVTNDVTFNNATSINFDATGITTNTTQTALSSTSGTITKNGTVSVNFNNLEDSTYRTGYGITTNSLKVGILTSPATLNWAGIDGDNTWDKSPATKNWVNSGIAYNFMDGDTVIFDNSATEKSIIVAPGGISVADMTVSGTGYAFEVTAGAAPAITSEAGIALNGATLDIKGYQPDQSSPHTGPTNNQTILQAGSGTITGFNPNVTIAGQATVDFLIAEAKLSLDDKKVDVETVLTWNSVNPNRQAHGTFTVVDGGEFTLGAVLNDNGGSNKVSGWDGDVLTKKGDGTLILAGTNDYTKGTFINAGTVQVEKDTNLGRATGELTFDGGILKTMSTMNTSRKTTVGAGKSGTLDVAASTTLTHTGDLVGAIDSTLIKIGAGALNLSGNNATGFAGTLRQDAGGVDLATGTDLSNATFTQTAGTLTTANNAKLGASSFSGTITPTGTLDVASAIFDGATINLGALSAGNTIDSTGAVAFQNNNTTINLNAAGITSGEHTLISSSALTGNDKIHFNLTGLASGIRGGYYVENTRNLKLSLISGNTSLAWAGTAADNAWNTNSGNMNWTSTLTGINFNFVNQDDVIFGATGHKRVAVASSGVQVKTMGVTGSGYVFDVVAGATAIKAVNNIAFGNSTINLTGYTPDTTSPYTGPVNQITLLESAMGTLTGFDPAKVTINNQSSVDFLTASARMDGNNKAVVDTSLTWHSQNASRKAHGDFTVNSGTFTLGAPLADNTTGNRRDGWDGKSLTKLGNGTLNLTGTHSYTGATNVNKGTLALANNARLGGGGDVNVASGATLALAGNTSASVAGRAVVNGIVDVGAGGTLSFGGDVILKQNSTVKLAATNDSNLGKLATAGSIDIQGASKLVTGGESYYKNQVAMTANNGINGFANLTSDFFDLSLEDNKVVLSGVQSFSDIQDNLFGSGQTGNMRRGAAYSDRVMAGGNTGLNSRLENYITKLDTTSLSYGDKHKAMRQLCGEYAAVGHNVQAATLMRHQGQITNHMNQLSFNNRLAAALPVGGASDSALAAYMAPPGVRPMCRPASRYSGGSRYEDCYFPSGGPNRIWGGGFGAWADQDNKNGVAGYEFKGGGFTLGYDRQFTQNFMMGFAGSYMHGKTDVNGLSAQYDHDVLNLSLYAGYYHPSNFFAKGGIGFGYGWNDYDVRMVVGGKRSGDYHTQAYNANLELGYDWRLPYNFAVTPSVGLDYTYYRTGKWSESVSGGGVANWFESNNSHILDIPLAVRASYMIMLGGSRYIAPEIRVAWVPTIGNNNPSIRTGYVGTGGGMSQNGIDPGNNRWQFGGGVKAKILENLEARLDYKYEVRSRYDDHNLSASVGLSF